MKTLLRFLGVFLFAACFAHSAKAACTVSSPNYTAASASTTDVSACAALATHCGDIINIPAGTPTWSSQLNFSPPTGCSANQGLTIQGATTCTGGCAAGSGGSGLAFTDSTNITISASQGFNFTGCSNTAFCTVANLTFTQGAASFGGIVQIGGTKGQVSFRIHHVHFIDSAGGGVILVLNDWGLADHIRWDDTAGTPSTPLNMFGDTASAGYYNWQAQTSFGSNQFLIVEDSFDNSTNTSTGEGFADGYEGCQLTFRHSIVTNQWLGQPHGTDSGNRGCEKMEYYNLTLTNNTGQTLGLLGTRSGSYLVHDNTAGGTTGYLDGIGLQLYRYLPECQSFGGAQCAVETGNWGAAFTGLNWTPLTVIPGTSCGSVDCVAVATLNAPARIASHAYTTGQAVAGPSSTNEFQVLGNCTSASGTPNWSGTTPGNTVSDGTCTWTNVGGSTTASVNPSVAGFLNTDNETACSSGANCTRYLDTNGGVYPYRDQQGIIGGQTIYGNYQWNNTATGSCTSACFTMGAEPTTTTIIQSGRDYFNGSSPAGYTPYTYPDPLQGNIAATPSCTPGSGTYTSTQSVTCTDGSAGAIMCYTTNGSTPQTNGTTGCTTGTLYSTAISVSSSETLEVIAGGTSYVDSSVVSYAYTINSGSTSPSTIGNGIKISNGVIIR